MEQVTAQKTFGDTYTLEKWHKAWSSGSANDYELFEGFAMIYDLNGSDALDYADAFDGVLDYLAVTDPIVTWNMSLNAMLEYLRGHGTLTIEIQGYAMEASE